MEPIADLTLKQHDRLRLLRENDASTSPAHDSPESKPGWYQQALDWRYHDECRAKCIDCAGLRTKQPFEVEKCKICRDKLDGPCSMHACATCEGTGLVCPGCNGMRWIKKLGNIRPCDTCREGNNINGDAEARAIHHYLASNGWRKVTREELMRRRTERSRAQMEEAKRYHDDWAKLHSAAPSLARKHERLSARQRDIQAKYGDPVSGPELLQLAGTGTPKRKPKGGKS